MKKASKFLSLVIIIVMVTALSSCSGLERKTVTIPTDIYADESYEIQLINVVESTDTNIFEITLPPYCAAMVVLSDDVNDFPAIIADSE